MTPRGPFRDLAALALDQPLPFAADKDDRQITAAERRFLHGKAEPIIAYEPVRHVPTLAAPPLFTSAQPAHGALIATIIFF